MLKGGKKNTQHLINLLNRLCFFTNEKKKTQRGESKYAKYNKQVPSDKVPPETGGMYSLA